MLLDKKNIVTQRPDKEGYKSFMILDLENLGDFLKRTSLIGDIDGILVEHSKWYKDPDKVDFDPRLYSIVKGSDEKYYAISFRDFQRVDEIKEYEELMFEEHVNTKIRPVEEIKDDFVLAKTQHILDSLSPQDPLNIYRVIPRFDGNNKFLNSYSIDYNSIQGLKLMAEIYRYIQNGNYKVVISTDDESILEYNGFFIKYFYKHVNRSTIVPRSVPFYVSAATDIIMTTPDIAKIYEQNGYKLIKTTYRTNNDYSRVREKKEEK
ncbi:MAG: hypothetical protein J5634_02900 [Bacilli bacterium]|nr:hypothetical protein [Bacilli bacterium]